MICTVRSYVNITSYVQKNKNYFLLFFLLFLSFPLFSLDYNPINISNKKLQDIKLKYGEQAVKRVILWDQLIEKNKNKPILIQLKNINNFFNKFPYKRDKELWGENDYWATPYEFLSLAAGDCEDYAIAKYFTLKKLGIPEENLRIIYVTYKNNKTNYEEAHMVLSYLINENSTPIILDNINKKLLLANQRTDLTPVYSFNAKSLWQAQSKGKEKVGKNNLKSWENMINKI